ncbi:allantoate amidohydrolase [Stackebrandtia nassauensis]|uniref:Amidase, hydantoinase/carbamoylase family n=1 Tax=Stackebrandtia nassauensis (strain DSM 44728 / CIP 108903 / NRRL B-16338 / NBRC 102104 / LLR-40K-21) TaxID=446470 RepID=D3PY75_STANL|nr:allantoate amidohydrolase [Stackebrandtia nassauensis]ADD45404.1 amidase, hydantoinase/carbamoylase family [Stackebrandtia nassauensis DSM 44728]
MWFEEMWRELAPIGRFDGTGGYRRFTYTPAELECRAWFTAQATSRGLSVETDRNGNLWAWWGDADAGGAIATGSHLDSVPDGGAFDGPLGIVSAFAAIDLLRQAGFTPGKPIAVAAFAEEEGARFGVACLGSRLLSGAITPEAARALTDDNGVTLADAMATIGADPDAIGRDERLLSRIDAYVELHIEQGRAQVDMDAPVAVAEAIWPHGRWRMDFTGRADHAGTTRLEDRADPMLTYANTVLAARKKARLAGAVATVGRIVCEPNGTNAIPSRVRAWLDARAPELAALEQVVTELEQATVERAGRDGTSVTVSRESYSPHVAFDVPLRDRLAGVLGGAPLLATGAGHDAGVLAASIPTAMLFVRNPTGVSHSPAENAEMPDCLAGADALATVLRELAA